MTDNAPLYGRRTMLAVGGAATVCATGPVAAQSTGAALPCLVRAGDVVALTLEGTGAPVGTVTVFGHAFRMGDLASGAVLKARSTDGRDVRAQLDIVARHPDGSVRFAIVSLAPTVAIAAGSRLVVVLAAATGPVDPPLGLATVSADRRAVLELDASSGAPWQADLLAILRSAPTAAPWQSGPLALQYRVVLPVPPSVVGGVTSLRLVADVAFRLDGSMWVEAWLRNDIAMRPGGGNVTYAARLMLDGREALRSGSLQQFQYTAWGRLAGSLRDRAAPEPPRPRHDAGYLADAGAVPRYDLSIGVDEAFLVQMGRSLAEPSWHVPRDARGILRSMPAGGGRSDIGPVTRWQATWLMSGDTRAAAYCIGQAEAAGLIPWHMWDPQGAGSWLDVRRWPRLWTDGRGGVPPGGLMQQVPGDTGWTPDTSHQPDLSTVPLLLTGRRAFLDNLQAQSAWNVMGYWPAPRGDGQALIVRGNQVRGAAWGLRQIGNSAWFSPEGDASGDNLRAVAAGNWAWLRAQIPLWTRRQGEAHGWIPGEYGVAGALPPWQQDYFASTAAAAARRGVADARAVLDWMENFLAGRFLSRERGFNPHDGCAYLIAISPLGSPENPYATWAAIGDATRARGMSNAGAWAQSNGDYGQLALQSLAQLVEVTGSDRARAAHAWLLGAGAPYTSAAQLVGSQFNIAPKDFYRVPARAPRCRG